MINNTNPTLIRITTVPISLKILLKGQLKYMSNYFNVIGISSPGGDLETVRNREGVEIIELKMERKPHPLKDILSIKRLFFILLKRKPLIVHTHTPKAGMVGMIASYFARVPLRLHTVAGLPLMETSGVKRRVLDFVERLTYSFATMVYPNSFGLRDFIVNEKLCNAKKLKVIGFGSSNGIDTTYYDPICVNNETKLSLKETINIDEGDFVFIFIGRLVKDKGINELVAAFKELNSSKCKLLLVGPFENDLDPLLPETEQVIEENQNIITVGYQDDVRPYLAISDALVFPSYREGFPNVVMQAGAMGLPSIVTSINGCNEIIIEGENGIIIPPKNKKSLMNAMQFFLSNQQEVKRMASNARHLIVSRYEQKAVWEALLAEYKRLEADLEK